MTPHRRPRPFPTVDKLDALADLTLLLPRLTATELHRLRALGEAMRRERAGHYRAETVPELVVGPLAALSVVLDRINDLDSILGVADDLARLGPDESMALAPESQRDLAAMVGRLAAMLDALLGVDGKALDDLRTALRAAADPPT